MDTFESAWADDVPACPSCGYTTIRLIYSVDVRQTGAICARCRSYRGSVGEPAWVAFFTVGEGRGARPPDGDLCSYLRYNDDPIYRLEDIADVLAEVPGHNDEDDWYWVLLLKDGRYVLTDAWCDCTGWDCQSGGNSRVAEGAEAAAMLAPSSDHGRKVRDNLLAQLRGQQPIGLEVGYHPDDDTDDERV